MNVVDVEDLRHGIDYILPDHKVALRLLLDLRLVSSGHLLHLNLHIVGLLLLLCNFLVLLSHLLRNLVHSVDCFTRCSSVLLLLLNVVKQNDLVSSPLIRNILCPDLIYGL